MLYMWASTKFLPRGHRRGRAGPVTEISVFATEISVTGMKIFPYEHSCPVTGTKHFGQNSFAFIRNFSWCANRDAVQYFQSTELSQVIFQSSMSYKSFINLGEKRHLDNSVRIWTVLLRVTILFWNDPWAWLINNYSPKWRWLAVDIYRAAKRRVKYPTLATDTEVNSCFSIY